MAYVPLMGAINTFRHCWCPSSRLIALNVLVCCLQLHSCRQIQECTCSQAQQQEHSNLQVDLWQTQNDNRTFKYIYKYVYISPACSYAHTHVQRHTRTHTHTDNQDLWAIYIIDLDNAWRAGNALPSYVSITSCTAQVSNTPRRIRVSETVSLMMSACRFNAARRSAKLLPVDSGSTVLLWKHLKYRFITGRKRTFPTRPAQILQIINKTFPLEEQSQHQDQERVSVSSWL